MRARQLIYHVECFQCVVCQRQLVAGDEFCQRGDDGLFCKADFDAIVDCHADNSSAGFGFVDDNGAHDLKLNNNNNNNGKDDAKRQFTVKYTFYVQNIRFLYPYQVFRALLIRYSLTYLSCREQRATRISQLND